MERKKFHTTSNTSHPNGIINFHSFSNSSIFYPTFFHFFTKIFPQISSNKNHSKTLLKPFLQTSKTFFIFNTPRFPPLFFFHFFYEKRFTGKIFRIVITQKNCLKNSMFFITFCVYFCVIRKFWAHN